MYCKDQSQACNTLLAPSRFLSFSLVKCWEMLLNISASRKDLLPSHLQPPASSENSANTLWDKLAVHLGLFHLFYFVMNTTQNYESSIALSFLQLLSLSALTKLRINKYPQESKRSKFLSSLWKNTFISGILITFF